LVAKVLCEKHNSELSPLDTVAGDLLGAIGRIDEEFRSKRPASLNFQFDGTHIERWVLKTVLGLVSSQQIEQSAGGAFTLKEKCLELLCVPHAKWPSGWGLYMALPAKPVYHSSSFELVPKHNSETGEILALGIKFNGIEMTFAMGKPAPPGALGVLRPSVLVFENQFARSVIALNWRRHKPGTMVKLSHVGIYSGPSPDHNLLHAP
jgi:hypothetical protein